MEYLKRIQLIHHNQVFSLHTSLSSMHVFISKSYHLDNFIRVQVRREEDFIYLKACYPYIDIWKDVTEPKEVGKIILNRNTHHMQQLSPEEGRVHDPVM